MSGNDTSASSLRPFQSSLCPCPFSLVAFGLCLIPFVLLATLNSAGYRYGASDQAFYIPAVLKRLDPALFPRDGALIESQARLTVVDEAIALVARATGLSLPVLFAGAYLAALVLLAWGAASLGALLYRTPWAVAALLAALTLRHAITKSGTNTLEGYFHPRQLAFAFGVLAVAWFLRGSLVRPAVLVAVAFLIHSTTASWFGVWLVVATFVAERRARVPLGAAAVPVVAVAVWAIVFGPLSGRLTRFDPAWLETLSRKDYLFALDWPATTWLVNLAYIPVILWAYRRRTLAGIAIQREKALVIGCLTLAVIFAGFLPFHAAGVALAIQLQPARVFWMLDLLAVVYVVWMAAEGVRRPTRRAQATAAVLIALSVVRGTYLLAVRFPDRQVAAIWIADNDWGRVMAWARTTDPGAAWLADPLHAARYGTSVRVAGERDVLVEEGKDTAIGMYDRGIAMRVRERLVAVGDFATITPARCRELAATYALTYLVTDRVMDLPVAFQSGTLHVYALR